MNCNRNYILFTKLPWPENSEGTFHSSSLPSVYHTRWRLHSHCFFNAERQRRKAVIPFFLLSSSVVSNLFLTVAHFHFENFPWPYPQSIAQLQFSTSLSSSVARISQKGGGGGFWKLETSVNELDPNFHQSWIRLRWFFCRNQVISKKKVFAPESAIFCVFSVDLKKNKQ